MKKVISILLAFTLILCITLPSFASSVFNNINYFDINDYTLEEYLSMSIEEQKNILNCYIERYNPFGLRDKYSALPNSIFGVNPLWSSGNNWNHTEQEISTHQLITLKAISRFIELHGFYNVDGTAALVITLSLMAASGLPDIDERDHGLFRSHFYEPESEKNYAGQTDFTAKTEAVRHFNTAYVILRSNFYNCVNTEQFADVIEEIGRALHYLQDVSCPYHSSNKTAATSNHALFEKYVDEQIETILNENRTVTCQYSYYAENNNVESLMYHAAKHSAIKYSKIYIHYENYDVASYCIWDSVNFSECMLHKLFYDSRNYYISNYM